MSEQTFSNDFTNYEYRAACGRGDFGAVPDCGHPDCGLQCDVAIVEARGRRFLKSTYHSTAVAVGGGDHGTAAIVELLHSGMTLTDVAGALDLPVALVTYRIIREDHNDVLAAEALMRSDPTLSQHELARRSGLRQQSIGRLAEALGIALVPTAHAARHDAAVHGRIAELKAAGKSVRAIALELGVSKSTVARVPVSVPVTDAALTMTA